MRYVAIRSEGGLIPYDILDKIAAEEIQGQKPGDFGLGKGRRLTDEITRVWSDAQSLWDIFRRRRDSLSDKDPYGTTLTRDRWIVPLLSDADMLGFELKLQPSAAVVNNLTFPISHRSGEGEDATPVHIEGLKIDLDRRLHTKLRTSPQAMMQEFLNHSEPALWGIVTNGVTFRILRDSSRTARPTYLEFDLESILDGNRFAEFAVFYRLCHRTRFPRAGQDPSECLLEKYYQQSIDEGSRVREGLRDGVEEALKILGSAFLQHPNNAELRERITSKRLEAVQYHRQLLLLVYRLLFLMVAEERKLIVAQGDAAERNQKFYDEWYSVTRLRDRAANIVEESPFGDLWIGLLRTFSLFEYGLDTNALGIPPLNGDLFHETRAIPDLSATQLYNHDLLRAVRHLSTFKADHVRQRVNYSALDVEELGSVYESLLDYQPVVEEVDGRFTFELSPGMERKKTGSYYTRPELVHELIESALVPVMQERLAKAEKDSEGRDLITEQKAKENALLDMSVCDPACGSGHFLLAAARRLGKELARIRTGEDEPKPGEFHLAVRDIISHCIYGVDLNPLAVDLCKVALWLEGHWAGKPLSFLDHRIRCGNSLIGVLDPKMLEDGIPDDAFTAVTGDDKKAAAYFRKRNKKDRTSRGLVFEPEEHAGEYAKSTRELRHLLEDTAADVRKKAQMYSSWRTGMQHSHDEAAADVWTGQFFIPLRSIDDSGICTTKDFLEFAVDNRKKPLQVGAAQAIAQRLRFFLWHLEFPEVMQSGGFDVVLGNPPWERIKGTEQEYFANRAPKISEAANASARGELIQELRDCAAGTPERALYESFIADTHALACSALFASCSGRFPLSGRTDVNTYALFAELASVLTAKGGSAGFLLPAGFITDVRTKDLFSSLFQKDHLRSFYCFDNAKGIFPAIHRDTPFGLLTIAAGSAEVEFCNEVLTIDELRDQRRRYTLSWRDIQLANPNTETAPVFRSKADARLTLSIYRRVPHFVNERDTRSGNPWGITFLRMFDMATDSGRFLDKFDLEEQRANKHKLLPLIEGKMVRQFDHRAGTFAGIEKRPPRGASLPEPSPAQKADPAYEAEPWYWVDRDTVVRILDEHDWRGEWTFGYRFGTNPTNERTLIASAIPQAATPHVFPQILADHRLGFPRIACLFANLNTLVVDFVCRQKMSRQGLDIFIVKQLPILHPSRYTDADIRFIVTRVVELTYNSDAMKPFADDLGFDGPPYRMNTERRATLRAELDAYFAHLYALDVDELRYVLDPRAVFGEDFPSETFRVLREREIKQHGEYRTQRLVLEAYDELAKSDRFRDEMPKRVSAVEVPRKAVTTHA